jgi:hypothetical protein
VNRIMVKKEYLKRAFPASTAESMRSNTKLSAWRRSVMSVTETSLIELKTKTASSESSNCLIAKIGRRASRTPALSDLIRYRYNTMGHETPGGGWKWIVVLEDADGFHEILVKSLIVNVRSSAAKTICLWLVGNITWPVTGDFVS